MVSVVFLRAMVKFAKTEPSKYLHQIFTHGNVSIKRKALK